MPIASLLGDCWAKFGRGMEHLDMLDSEVRAWQDSDPYDFVRDFNAYPTRYPMVLKVLRAPDLDRWSLIAGDAIHNFRCSLDHLIHALAIFQRLTLNEEQIRGLQFPICDTPTGKGGFSRKAKRDLCGWTSADKVWTAVEGVQPWNRPHELLPPLLSILRDFDNADKHRLLRIAMATMTQAQFKNIRYRPSGPGLGWRAWSNPGEVEVKDGAEIGAIVFDGPASEVSYDFAAQITITVNHKTGPAPNFYVRTAINPLVRMIAEDVRAVIGIVSAAA